MKIILKTTLTEILEDIDDAGFQPKNFEEGYLAMQRRICYYKRLIEENRIKLARC